mgnify:CR=1 FL=1
MPWMVIGQADYEIQVYASAITPQNVTLTELHSNYTFNGIKGLANPKSARWINESIEITHGFGHNFELGFYMFTGISPDGKWTYFGNHIRPRVTVPEEWGWNFGASLSLELGFIKLDPSGKYVMDGELRPILDKTLGDLYVSFNPNIGFALTGPERFFEIAPQLKTVYNVKQKFGLGFEYYSALGTFARIEPFKSQEHLLGPIFDLYSSKKWELQTGFLFGLTPGSNQQIFKILVGRRL